MGINNEISILENEFHQKIQQLLLLSEKHGFVNLQLMGLQFIPDIVLKAKKLKRIHFDFNIEFRLKNGIPEEFQVVKKLSFRSCKIPDLPNNMNNLRKIITLNLEDNNLEYLPSSFVKMRTLQNLGTDELISSVSYD
jgi:hypothetical protein